MFTPKIGGKWSNLTTLLKTNILPQFANVQACFFPFPKVGYVSSLEGHISQMGWFNYHLDTDWPSRPWANKELPMQHVIVWGSSMTVRRNPGENFVKVEIYMEINGNHAPQTFTQYGLSIPTFFVKFCMVRGRFGLYHRLSVWDKVSIITTELIDIIIKGWSI